MIPVELQSVVDSSFGRLGYVSGLVTEDVRGTDGRVALPAHSGATIAIRACERKGPLSNVVLGLYSVNVGGSQHSFSNGHHDYASVSLTDDAGKGPAHASVHLQYGYILEFKLESPVQLR